MIPEIIVKILNDYLSKKIDINEFDFKFTEKYDWVLYNDYSITLNIEINNLYDMLNDYEYLECMRIYNDIAEEDIISKCKTIIQLSKNENT